MEVPFYLYVLQKEKIILSMMNATMFTPKGASGTSQKRDLAVTMTKSMVPLAALIAAAPNLSPFCLF